MLRALSLELDATLTAASRPPGDPPAGLRPGTMLAHFRIDAMLGKGGMGEVYRATDLALDRPVALKVLPAAVADDPLRRERMFREARSQARITHPNVCHIYYVGQEVGVVFFAMELVAGQTLAERLAEGPLAPGAAIELVRQAALGLREAHRHGFTHRDVKPSNLMVDREGRVKVVDFGLVKAMGDAPSAPGDSGSSSETGLVGTPLYMAPEQAAGAPIDVRADIYALGATLHHLIAGRPPFEAASQDELATRHRESPRPRLAVGGKRGREVTAVDAVISRMMAKRPGDRFADYDELIAELERVAPERTRPAGFVVRALAMSFDLALLTLVLVPAQLASQAIDHRFANLEVWQLLAPIYVMLGLSRWGTTVGRRVLEIEVVTVPGMRRPSIASAALREAIQFGALVLGGSLKVAGGVIADVGGGIALVGIVFAVASVAYASLRTPDKRAVWDRVAGTMVRYRRGVA